MGLGIAAGVGAAGLAGLTTAASYNMQQQAALYQEQVLRNQAAGLAPQIQAAAAATEMAGKIQGQKAAQEIGATTARFGAAGIKTNVPGSAELVKATQKMTAVQSEEEAVQAGAWKTYGLETEYTSAMAGAEGAGFQAKELGAMLPFATAAATLGGLSKTFLSGATAGLG